MAKRISDLPSGDALIGSEPLPVVQSGTTVKSTIQNILTYVLNNISKSSVGLGNVDNTSDANKPISIATQTALNAKQNTITNTLVLSGSTSGTATISTDSTASTVSVSKPTIVNGAVTVSATTDASLSAEYILATKNRDFSAAPDWTGTNWIRPTTVATTAVSVDSVGKTYTRTSGSFITEGYQVGMTATWVGFANAANNTAKTITALSALVMTVTEAVTSEAAGASVTCSSPVWSHAVAGANATTLATDKLTAVPTNGDIYQLVATVVTKTAGTLNLGIGGGSIGNTIGRAVATETAYTANVLSTGTGAPTITPSAGWVGWIDDISIKKVTPSTSILTGKMANAAFALKTIIPNTTSLGVGSSALEGSVQTYCVALGLNTLYQNTGAFCTGAGAFALQYNTGISCSGFGSSALQSNTGINCSGFGGNTLASNTGASCSALGNNALYQNTGANCTAVGLNSLYQNSAPSCAGVGTYALQQNAGSGNTAIGSLAGYHVSFHSQSVCTFLGYGTTVSSDSLSNSTALGASAVITASNQVVLGNTSVTSVTTYGGITSKNASVGVGYETGAGGTVTQTTSRTTGVTINKVCGSITLVSAAGTSTWQSFTITNSAVAATDTILVCQKSGTDLYMTHVTAVAAGSFKITFATTGGTTTEQPVFNFSIIKGVTA